jgi:hypothetical protein
MDLLLLVDTPDWRCDMLHDPSVGIAGGGVFSPRRG